jgi:hypothetical protein
MASSSSDEAYSDGMAELVAQLSDHPEYLLDKQFELPGWLYAAKENCLVWHDPNVVPDPNFPGLRDKGFWAKVSSAAALKQACADRHAKAGPGTERLDEQPLTLFVLPNTPLRDAFVISALVPGELKTPAIHFLNPVERLGKVFAYGVARELVTHLNTAMDDARVRTGRLTTAVDSKIRHREEMERQYKQAEAAYKASPTPEAHLQVLAALSRLRVAHQVVFALVSAQSTVTALRNSLQDKVTFLEQAMNNYTLMGCPVQDHPGGTFTPSSKLTLLY